MNSHLRDGFGRSGFNPTFRATSLILALAAIGLTTLPTTNAYANPQDGQVVAGSATIVQETAAKVGITQTTDKAIIDWQKYSIGASEHVQYYQPSAASVTLNRVVGQDPSQILGRLTANGQVFLVNPNGIFFGKNAQIDVAGLVASTHNIRNEDFLAGKYNFNIPGNPGAAVINEGNIRIADTGIAAFVAPSVANRGVIAARLGKIMLASANGFTLDFTGDQLITFLVNDEVAQTAFDIEGKQLTSFVENAGRIEAQGGYVLLTAKAAENVVHSVINQSGSIEATSVGQQNGEIVLAGGLHGVVSNTGILDASGKGVGEAGGTVQITGEKIGLFDGTRIDVSGDWGGGKAIVGGDYLGGNASDATMAAFGIQRESQAIQTAIYTNMASEAFINADAIRNGKGGKVVLWSDNRTLAYGSISAKGGNTQGDGGFIEVSGKKQLDIVNLRIDASAQNGKAGTVLYDPGDVYITDDSLAVASYNVADFTSTTPGNQWVFQNGQWIIGEATNIAASNIEATLNTGTSVIIRGNPGTPGNDGAGQIYVQKSIHKTRGGDAMLSLFAADEIILYAGNEITSTSGKLDIYMDADYDRYTYGLIDLQAGSAIRTNGGFVNLNGSDINRDGVIDTTDRFGNSGQTRTAHDYFQTLNFSFLNPWSGFNPFGTQEKLVIVSAQNNSGSDPNAAPGNPGATPVFTKPIPEMSGNELLNYMLDNNLTPDPENPFWKNLYTDGKASSAQIVANKLFQKVDTYRSATVANIESAIKNNELTLDAWVAVVKTVGKYDPTKAAKILFAGILDGRVKADPSDPVWNSVKTNGTATDYQKELAAIDIVAYKVDKNILVNQKGSGQYVGTAWLETYEKFDGQSITVTAYESYGKGPGQIEVKLKKLGEMNILGVKLIAADAYDANDGKPVYGSWPTQCVNLAKGLISGLTGKPVPRLDDGKVAYMNVASYFKNDSNYKAETFSVVRKTETDAKGKIFPVEPPTYVSPSSPSAGDIISFAGTTTSSSDPGHVAIVKEISESADGRTKTISLFEQNTGKLRSVAMTQNDQGEWVTTQGAGIGHITGWAHISPK